ncbi:MAG TPA: hypothetical protein P5267_00565, partial [Patescibacteria group bacterium]|nr:hypothetical protein [Patescibacteria group bacterium]
LEYKPTPEQESDADGRATEGAGKGSDEGIDELFRQGIITKEARDAYYDNKLRKSGWWPKEGGLRTGGGATGSLTGDPGRDLGSAFKKLAGDGNADPVKDLENLGKGLWEGLKKADAWMKGDDNP